MTIEITCPKCGAILNTDELSKKECLKKHKCPKNEGYAKTKKAGRKAAA